jgi:WD40 repeat protein
VILWDVAAGKEAATLEVKAGGVFSVSFAPDSKTLASGGRDGALFLFDLAGGKPVKLKGHERPVTAIAFAPDGRTLASVSFDMTARLWPVPGK